MFVMTEFILLILGCVNKALNAMYVTVNQRFVIGNQWDMCYNRCCINVIL